MTGHRVRDAATAAHAGIRSVSHTQTTRTASTGGPAWVGRGNSRRCDRRRGPHWKRPGRTHGGPDSADTTPEEDPNAPCPSVQRRRESFDAVVRRQRKAMGQSEEKLAEKAGCDRQSINRVENAACDDAADDYVDDPPVNPAVLSHRCHWVSGRTAKPGRRCRAAR